MLLSIKPSFVEKIFSGEKEYEYRKTLFRRNDISAVVIYATKPVGMIVGEFKIAGIVDGSPEDVWESTRLKSGISKSFYYAYFSGKELAYAIKIGSLERYQQEINPYEYLEGFAPPQSFMYLDGWNFEEESKVQRELFN